ncbi:MAG: YbjN domain-containing protein [Verrucomicrobiota bacterium]
MNDLKLFTEVRSWLDAEKFSFSANVENTSIQLCLDLNHGLIPVRLLCEESPVILQVVCSLPVKAPREKIFGTSLALLRLNARLRMGAFHLDTEDGLVMFRLSQPIQPDSDLRKQIREAFDTARNTLDANFLPLILLFCSTPNARKGVSKLNLGGCFPDTTSGPSHDRFKWN